MAGVTAEQQVGTVLVGYLAQHRARLLEQDARLRAGDPEGVHQMRVAARRLRSALASYAPILEGDSPAVLAEELRWLGGVLSPARDAEVLRARFDAVLEAQPDALALGAATRRIDDELGGRSRAGRADAETALDGERYARLLSDLSRFVDSPPFAHSASRPARKVLPKLLDADLARVRRRHRAWERTADPSRRAHALHQVRKAAKRLRYAAESAQPVLGDRATDLARQAEALQELLGAHQDTVVARTVLTEMGLHAHDAGEDELTFGRLHAIEEARAAELVAAYPDVLARLGDGG